MPDSGALDVAVLQRLSSDAALVALVPNGIWFDQAPPNSTRYVLVSIDDSFDGRRFEGRAFEAVRYLMKAVMRTTTPNAGPDVRAAAARIDALFDPQPPDPPADFVVEGYGVIASYRDPEIQRLRHDEEDAVDPTIRYYHRGAHYLVTVSTPT